MGISMREQYDLDCDYYMFFVEKNYFIYRILDDMIMILEIFNEKEDIDDLLEETICYVDDYPEINDDDEEEYSVFVKNNNLCNVCSGDILEDVLGNVLYQKGVGSTITDYVAALNYYLENDNFMDFEK